MSRFGQPELPAVKRPVVAVAHAPPIERVHRDRPADDAQLRTGVICNPISHQNMRAEIAHRVPAPDVVLAAPRTHGELAATLAEFAARGIDLLVIDGGDGTIRDVLTAAAEAFGEDLPQVALLPNGKTNALALDLGVPGDWTLDAALSAARTGGIRRRVPLVVDRRRAGAPPLHGFLLGAGNFVRATELAQRTHRIGAFHGVAVALALVWALLQVFLGRAGGVWRRGERMRVATNDGATLTNGPTFLLFASTLEHFPVGLRPLGPPRPGLKSLTIPAPPRVTFPAAIAILLGRMGGWLERAGYHHRDVPGLDVELEGGFILDGDHYADAAIGLRQGLPVAFVVP